MQRVLIWFINVTTVATLSSDPLSETQDSRWSIYGGTKFYSCKIWEYIVNMNEIRDERIVPSNPTFGCHIFGVVPWLARSNRQSTWTQQLSVRSNWPDPTQPKMIFWLGLVCVLVGFTSTFRNPHEIMVGLGLVWFRVPKLHLDTQLTFKHMYMHCIILG